MVRLSKLFTSRDVDLAREIIRVHPGLSAVDEVEKQVVVPRMDHINKVSGQNNYARYWAHILVHAIRERG